MFKFYNPYCLYLLVLIVLLAVLFYYTRYQRKKRIQKLGDKELILQMMKGQSKYRPYVKFWLAMASLAFFIIALARPQFGTKVDTRERHGIEGVIALDVSNSMMADDVKPTRLDKSKMLMHGLFDVMKDNQVGLVVYAGDAFVQLPITSDFVSARLFLDAITPSMIEMQGTDVEQAIDVSLRSFTTRADVNRAIFLITDGEDNEGGAVEAAKRAAKQGVHVYVLGVGLPEGAPVPDPGSDGYFTDEEGKVVISKLIEEIRREIAKAGDGAYIYVDNSTSAQKALLRQIDALSKAKLSNIVYSEYNEQYQSFLLIAILLLIIDILIIARKDDNSMWKILLKRKSAAMVMLLGMVLASCAPTDNDHIREGNKLYKDSIWDKAQVEYQKAAEVNAQSAAAHYNVGCTQEKQTIRDKAYESFDKASRLTTDTMLLSEIHHNLGVVKQDSQKLDVAIDHYKNALRLNPDDDATRYNLVLAMHQLKKQQQEQQQQQNQEQKKDEQQNKEEEKPKEEEQEQQKEDPNQLNKQNAEQLLQAAMQKEKQTQERVQKAQQTNAARRQLDKQW